MFAAVQLKRQLGLRAFQKFFRIPCRGIEVFLRGSASGKEASFIFLFASCLS